MNEVQQFSMIFDSPAYRVQQFLPCNVCFFSQFGPPYPKIGPH